MIKSTGYTGIDFVCETDRDRNLSVKLTMKAWRRYTALAVVFIEATVLAGSIFGWASLVYVFEVRPYTSATSPIPLVPPKW